MLFIAQSKLTRVGCPLGAVFIAMIDRIKPAASRWPSRRVFNAALGGFLALALAELIMQNRLTDNCFCHDGPDLCVVTTPQWCEMNQSVE